MRIEERRYRELRREGKTREEILAQFQKEEAEATFNAQVERLESALKPCLAQLEQQTNGWLALLQKIPAVDADSHASVKELSKKLQWLKDEGNKLQTEMDEVEKRIASQQQMRQEALTKLAQQRAQMGQNNRPPDWISPNGPFQFWKH